jgi:hypothetical protein
LLFAPFAEVTSSRVVVSCFLPLYTDKDRSTRRDERAIPDMISDMTNS